jgi:hypothetical protein
MKLLLLLLLISQITFAQVSLVEITGEERSLYRALCKAKGDNHYTLKEFREDAERLGIISRIPYNKTARNNLILLKSKVFIIQQGKLYYRTWKN